MHTSFRAFTHHPLHQIRERLRRGNPLRNPTVQVAQPKGFWRVVEEPRPDEAVWEDTEIDVRRVVL